VLKHYFVTALRNFWRFRLTTTVNVVGLALGLVCFIATYVFLDGLLKVTCSTRSRLAYMP